MPTRPATRPFRLPRLAAGLAAALLLASCDSPSGPRPAGPPAQVAIVSGDLQTGTVGGAGAPLVVRITDADGKPVAGQSVQFQVISGGGTVTPPTAATDAGGAASATWTLGTVARDTQRVEARVLSASGAVLATGVFRAVARPDAPAKLVTVAGQAQTAPAGAMLADSLAVRLTDRFDNPVSSQPIAWSVLSGGGRVNPPAATTDSSGVARTAWTLGLRVDSAQTAAASFGTVPADTFRATATVQGTLTKLKGDAQTGAPGAPLRDSLVVVLTAPSGQPVQGATIVWTTTSGSVVPATTRTDAAGRAATWWLLGDAGGPATATASVAGGPSAIFSATASQALTVQVVSGDGQTAYGGASLRAPLQVRVTDALGRPRAGVPVTWSATAGSGTVVPDSPTTGDDGTATARWTLGRDAGTDTAFATIGSGAPAEFNATSLGVTRLEKVLGDMHADSVGGAPYVLAVRLLDAANRPIAGATVTWSATEATFSPQQSVTAADGSASTTLTDSTTLAGSRPVHAEARMDDPARPPLTPNTFTDFVKTTLPLAPAALRVAQPPSGTGLPVGTDLRLAVELLDRNGSRVMKAGVPVNLDARGSDSLPDPQQPVTDSTGVAYARWKVTSPSFASIYATSPGLRSYQAIYPVGGSQPFPPLSLQDSIGNGFIYVYTAVLQRTQDSLFARTRAYSTRFEFQPTSGQGTDGPVYGRWVASVPLNAVYDDENWVNVDVHYVSGVYVVHDSVQFRAPPTSGGQTPVGAQVVSGNGQSAYGRAYLRNRLRVRVTDAAGAPVAGVAVRWSVADGSGAVQPDSPVSGADGTATATWRLGDRAGTDTVIVSIGTGWYATFTAQSLGLVRLDKLAGDMHADTVGGAPYVLTVRLIDNSSQPIAGAVVTWSANQASFDPPQSVTAADGTASTTITDYRTRAGEDYVRAQAEITNPSLPPLTPGTYVDFTRIILAGAPTALKVQPASGSYRLNSEAEIQVQLLDRFGSPTGKAGVPVTLTTSGSSAQPSPQQPVTDSTGVARARWTLNTTGTATVTASSPGLTSSTGSYNVGGGSTGRAPLFLEDSVANGFVYVYTANLMRTQNAVQATTRAYSTPLQFVFTSGQGSDGPYFGRWAGKIPLSAIYDDETWVYVDAYYSGGAVEHDSIQFRSPQAMSARPSAGTPSLLALQPADDGALRAAHGWPRTSAPDSPVAEAVYAAAPVASGRLRGGGPAAPASAGTPRVPSSGATSTPKLEVMQWPEFEIVGLAR